MEVMVRATPVINAGAGIRVTGSWNNYTITNTTLGTVTSVALSGGTTGLTVSGSPITTSGTFTLAGTLVVSNGGLGVSSLTPYAIIAGGSTSSGPTQQVSGLGLATQVLTSNGPGALPSWQNSTGGGGTTFTRQVVTAGPTATVGGGNYVVTVDPTSTISSLTLTLPAAVSDLAIVKVEFGGTLTSRNNSNHIGYCSKYRCNNNRQYCHQHQQQQTIIIEYQFRSSTKSMVQKKTINMKKFLIYHYYSRFWLMLNSETINQEIFNILLFGAKGDGKQVLDGVTNSTTTFTSATANFTQADVGKAIRLPRAGAAGHALVTTIASVSNSTTVILANSALSNLSSDTATYGTDNTTPIQNAILAGAATGFDYTVLIPAQWFVIAGPLITNIGGAAPNCQIYFPETAFDSASSKNRIKITIKGESGPTLIGVQINNNGSTMPHNGAVIETLIDGGGNGTSGSPASIFSTKNADGGDANINANELTFENLTIMVPLNSENGGPIIGGINAYYSAGTHVRNCQIVPDGNIKQMNFYATNDVAGLILNQEGGEVMNHVDDVYSLLGLCMGWLSPIMLQLQKQVFCIATMG